VWGFFWGFFVFCLGCFVCFFCGGGFEVLRHVPRIGKSDQGVPNEKSHGENMQKGGKHARRFWIFKPWQNLAGHDRFGRSKN